jgi:integrase
MASVGKGHIERLPSGSYRVRVYAGTDPLTGREIRLKATAKTADHAQAELARLLEQAAVGQRPESAATVDYLLDQYMSVADLDVSTRESYEGYIRRTIKPALGDMELRKLRGPVLDSFYARLRRCGDLTCNGRPFTEHRNVPALTVNPRDPRPGHQQIADAIAEMIASGQLRPGDRLPSVREMTDGGLRSSSVRRALATLAEEGLIASRQGHGSFVAEGNAVPGPSRRRRRGADHDCAQSGCQPHRCRPMSAGTIRQIHAILSGAFATAMRWEWITRNPAAAAKLPKNRRRSATALSPADVAKVITAARQSHPELATYLWLVAVTGARRGELCGLCWADLDLDLGSVHIAHNYLVRGGQRIYKDTKTHQERRLAIDPVTCDVLLAHRQRAEETLATVGVGLADSAYVFSNDPTGTTAWNPDWTSHQVARVAARAGVVLNIKSLRHYTATQLLSGGIDLRNTAARLGHGGGGATTLRHYADPVSEVDRRAATYLAQLTAPASSGDNAPPGKPQSTER